MTNDIEKVKLLIIGSGPSGYTAAIYASRANLHPVLYQKLQPNEQLTITTEVENYPGYADGVMGPKMMQNFEAQSRRMGADVRWGMATKVDWPHPGIASGSAICIAAMLRCGPPCRLAVAPSIRELYFIVWCDEIEQRCAHRFSRVTDYADFCHSRPAPAPVLMRLPTAGRVMKEEPTGASTYDQMK